MQFTHLNPHQSLDHVLVSHKIRLDEAMKRERLNQLLDDPLKHEQLARQRFFRMYRVRNILFRLAPKWAARLVL